MHVIAIASQKGGSGKTTLAGHLAVEAERRGLGPVALIDTDPQGSLAAHILGYTGLIQSQQYTDLKDQGYGLNDIVGQAGLAEAGPRLRRHVRQRACGHTAPALRGLRARARAAMVERQSGRPVPSVPVIGLR